MFRDASISREWSEHPCAEDLIWWADFRRQDVEKQRERRKTKAEEGGQKKEDETWKRRGVFFWEVLNGVGVDGVGVIFPIFYAFFPFFCAFFPFFFAFLCFS